MREKARISDNGSPIREQRDLFSAPPIQYEDSDYYRGLMRVIRETEERVRQRPGSLVQKDNLAFLKKMAEQTPEKRRAYFLEEIKEKAVNAIKDRVPPGDNPFSSKRSKSNCDYYCSLIEKALQKGLPFVEAVEKSLPKPIEGMEYLPYHVYLRCAVIELGEIMIDPTIAQYIKDYDDVFVGTRQELEKLVFDQNTTLIPRTNIPLDDTRMDYFRRVWGEESIPESEEGPRNFSNF